MTIVGGPGTDVINCEGVDINLTVEASNGQIYLGQAQNVVTIGSSATGGGSGSNTGFSSNQGGTTNGPTSLITLIDDGGYNTINLTQTPIGAWLNLNENNGQSQPIYNPALSNPNIEEQGQIENFSAAEFTALQNSTVSLQGSFQEVIGGSNDILYSAAPSSPTQAGSFIVLNGGDNVVYGAPGSNVVSFSGTNQVIQTTTTTAESQLNSDPRHHEQLRRAVSSARRPAACPRSSAARPRAWLRSSAARRGGSRHSSIARWGGSPAFPRDGHHLHGHHRLHQRQDGGIPAFMQQKVLRRGRVFTNSEPVEHAHLLPDRRPCRDTRRS